MQTYPQDITVPNSYMIIFSNLPSYVPNDPQFNGITPVGDTLDIAFFPCYSTNWSNVTIYISWNVNFMKNSDKDKPVEDVYDYYNMSNLDQITLENAVDRSSWMSKRYSGMDWEQNMELYINYSISWEYRFNEIQIHLYDITYEGYCDVREMGWSYYTYDYAYNLFVNDYKPYLSNTSYAILKYS
jgi:hypothetical protein